MIYKIKKIAFCISIISLFIIACSNSSSSREAKKTVLKDSLLVEIPKETVVTYHFDSILNDSAFILFKKAYSKEERHIIAALNRIDEHRIRKGSKIVIPDTFYQQLLPYSPFPVHLNLPDSVNKIALINQRIQWFAMYENKQMVRTGPVSTGRKSKPTPNKLYYTNFKSKRKVSTVNGSWIMPWYFNISNYGGIGMHQYALPGYPASHSCIRMYQEDAKWFFDWADQWILSADMNQIEKYGTPVLIFGRYDFEQEAPWKLLPQYPDTLKLTEEEFKIIESAVLSIKIHSKYRN